MTRAALVLLAALAITAIRPEPTAAMNAAATPISPVSRSSSHTVAQTRIEASLSEIRIARAGPAADTRFVAGRHYQVLNPAQPTQVPPGKIEVVYLFWYGCGGCYVLSPVLEAWQASKPAIAEYVRLPAPLTPAWQPLARLYFATQALGITEETHANIFDEFHVKGNPLNTVDLMVEFLGRYNVTAAKARETLASFSVDSEVRAATVRARRYRLTFVPAVVVNGKYVINAEQAGGVAAVPELIDYLVGLEAANRN